MNYVYFHKGHTHIRRVSSSEDARLILAPSQYTLAYPMWGKAPIEVCSISCFDEINPDDAEATLDHMEKLVEEGRLPSSGGFRLLRRPEMAAWSLSNLNPHEMAQSPDLPLAVKECLHDHPFVRAGGLYFTGGLVGLQLIQLLGVIYDVRRFADPESPGRNSKIRNYFKLINPTTVSQIVTPPPGSTLKPEHLRTTLLMQAWNMHPFAMQSKAEVMENPYAFIFRELWDLKDEMPDADAGLRLWKVTNRFLTYVKLLWTAGLGDRIFEPARFFKRQDEIESFTQFINNPDFNT